MIHGVEVPGSVTASTRRMPCARSSRSLAGARRKPVFLRVGWRDDHSAVIVDMATEDAPRALEITADGWSIYGRPVGRDGFQPDGAPAPHAGTEHDRRGAPRAGRLLSFAEDSDEFVLILGYLVGLLMPVGPLPCCCSRASRAAPRPPRARIVKMSVDPTRGADPQPAKDRRRPRDPRVALAGGGLPTTCRSCRRTCPTDLRLHRGRRPRQAPIVHRHRRG